MGEHFNENSTNPLEKAFAPMHAIDGNTNSVWHDRNLGPLTVTFPEVTRVHQYTICTASDTQQYDPVRWRLQGSCDGVTFHNLHVAESVPPRTRNAMVEPVWLTVRAKALETISTLGSEAILSIIDDVIECSNDPDPTVVQIAITTDVQLKGPMCRLDQRAVPYVETFARLLRHKECFVRTEAVLTLGMMYKYDKEAVTPYLPQLQETWRTEESLI